MFHSRSALAVQRSLVRSTLDERVTLYGPGVATQGPWGATSEAPEAVGTVDASVRPETAAERLQNDRAETEASFVVRMERAPETVAIGKGYRLVWERSDALGGPVRLSVTGKIDDHGRGRFIDLTCSGAAVPETVPETVPAGGGV